MGDPWGFGLAAFTFIGWVLVWVFIILAVIGAVIFIVAILYGLFLGVKSWFKRTNN